MSGHDEPSSKVRANTPPAYTRAVLVTVKVEQIDSDPEEPEEAKQDALCGAPLIVKVESRVANHTPAAIEEHSYVETMHNDGDENAEHRQSRLQSGCVLNASAAAVPFRNECPVCLKTLATPSGLQRHLTNHARKCFACRVCYRQFFKQESLDKHLKVHQKPSSYPCDQCVKTFKSKSSLHQHQKLHLELLPYYCATCEKRFALNCHYKKHLEAGKCVKPSSLICFLCNKNFDREHSLKMHLKSHETDRPFRCDTCDMTFNYKSTLVRHVQVHKNYRPYKCQYCDKTFTSFGLIKPHLRKHTGERPYPCDICLKSFSHKQNMERHKLRHNKVKQLICDICHKHFPRESRLKYHMRTHLADKLPFKCPLCHKCYSHRQNIQRHYKNKHPNETYECTQTDASVASIIWEALRKKERQENDYKASPPHGDECKLLPVEKDDIIGELEESSNAEFLSDVRNRNCQNGATIIP